jgi:hypothetical protein
MQIVEARFIASNHGQYQRGELTMDNDDDTPFLYSSPPVEGWIRAADTGWLPLVQPGIRPIPLGMTYL